MKELKTLVPLLHSADIDNRMVVEGLVVGGWSAMADEINKHTQPNKGVEPLFQKWVAYLFDGHGDGVREAVGEPIDFVLNEIFGGDGKGYQGYVEEMTEQILLTSSSGAQLFFCRVDERTWAVRFIGLTPEELQARCGRESCYYDSFLSLTQVNSVTRLANQPHG